MRKQLDPVDPDFEAPADVVLPPILGIGQLHTRLNQLMHAFPYIRAVIQTNKQREEEEQRRKAKWLDDKLVDAEPLVERWDKQAVAYRDTLTEVALEIYPITDGLEQANSTLRYSLEMSGAEIDVHELLPFIKAIARVRMFEKVVPMVISDPAYQRQIIERKIAHEFPVREEQNGRRNLIENNAAPPETAGAPAERRTRKNPFREERDSFGKLRTPAVQRRRVRRDSD